MDSDTEEWNAHFVDVFVPNIIWSSLCLVVGCMGNSIVLLIYVFKMKNHREERYFIPILAFVDLCATIFSTTYFILDYVNYVNFQSAILCKIITFFTYSWTAMSAHFLLVIAVQRYLKICKPIGSQMTLKWRRVATVVTVAFSSAFSSPLLVSAGIRQFDWTFNGKNTTVKTCALNANDDRQFDVIYFSITMLVIVVNIIAIIGVYIPIGRVIYRTFAAKKQKLKSLSKSEIDFTNEPKADSTTTVSSVCDTNEQPNINETVVEDTEHDRSVNETKTIEKSTHISTTLPKLSSTTSTVHHKPKNRKLRSKVNFNMMFLTVVIFYLLSYVPVIAIFFVRTDENHYWHSLSDSQVSLQMCLVRFYIINNIVNPFIYGYFDFQFRESIKSFFKCSC